MKYLFFLVLLTNIVFFLWEINGGVDTSDSQGELFHAEKEKLILLLSEIDSVVTTENISAKVQSILGSPATDQEQFPEEERKDVEDESDLDQELMLDEEPAVLSEIEAAEEVVIENRPEDAEVDQKVISAIEAAEIPEIEQERASEENIEVESVENPDIMPVGEQEEQVEAKNRIVQFFNQKPDQLPEQKSKQLSCYEIGPFADEATLQQWKKQLGEGIKVLESQSRATEEIKDFMVYYPAAGTFDKSKQNVSMLKDRGINDLWLFLKGDMRGAISLGLFQTETTAEIVRDRYRNDGLDIQIAPRHKKSQTYFAHLEMDSDQQEKVFQLMSDRKNIALSACSGNQHAKQ